MHDKGTGPERPIPTVTIAAGVALPRANDKVNTDAQVKTKWIAKLMGIKEVIKLQVTLQNISFINVRHDTLLAVQGV
jgi:hypothetical protein